MSGQTAVEGKLLHWWWNLARDGVDLKVIWEISVQHAFPVIGAVNVARAQGTPFQITELVEQE